MSLAAKTLPPEEVRRLFDYNADTGDLIWKDRPELPPRIRSRQLGKIAGAPDEHGYIRVGINRKVYQAHILVWIWFHNCIPSHYVDHIDRNPSNNAIKNLRAADNYQSARNRGGWRAKRSGLPKGVFQQKGSKRFYARIHCPAGLLYLGAFGTIEDAAAAYADAVKKHFGEFAVC